MSEQRGHWQTVTKEIEVTVDIYGNPITNSLGEPMSVTVEVGEWQFIPEEKA
jgi:hypothetical protein